MVIKAPVLRYYDVNDEVTMQCDASLVRMDLGAYFFKMDSLLHLHQKLRLKSKNDTRKLKKNVSQLCVHVKNLISIFWKNPQRLKQIINH